MSDTFTINITPQVAEYTVNLSEASDGQDGIDGESGIAPQIQDGSTGLEISTDEGDTWNPLVSYQTIIDATGVQSQLDDKGNLAGGNTWFDSQVFDGNVTLGGTAGETITLNARFNSSLYPSTTNSRDLGSTGLRFKDLWLAGTVSGAAAWNASVISGQYGGTGTANTGKTITLGANFLTTGTSGITLAAPSTGSPIIYTLPTTAATLARTDAAQTFTGTQTFGTIVATSISADSVSGEIDASNITSGIISPSILGTDGDNGLFLRHDSSWVLPANCYSINLSTTSSSPIDGATNYFANFISTPTTTASNYRIYISRNSRILSAEISSYASTAGTAEAWSMYIRVNNTTDYLIASLISGSNSRRWTNASLSIDLAAGDYFEIKMVNPTWATNPLGAIFAGYVYLLTL